MHTRQMSCQPNNGDLARIRHLLFVLALGLTLTSIVTIQLSNSSSAATPTDSRQSRHTPGQVITVCLSGGCDYLTIQAAVDAADNGDIIKVASGTYTDVSIRPRNDVTTTGLVTQVVYLSKTLTIQGGYLSDNWNVSDPDANPTTLDARRQGRVLYITGNISPTIEGLHIIRGNAVGLGGRPQYSRYDAGAGLYVFGATITLKNNRIRDNRTDGPYGYGGGLSVISGTVLLQRNTFVSNYATTAGGLFLLSSTGTLIENTFTENEWDGGAMFLRNCAATLTRNAIMSNHAAWGGGLYAEDCNPLKLNGNIIAANTAYNHGGGLYLMGCQVELFGNTIVSNTVKAYYGGGLYATYGSKIKLDSNIIMSNRAPRGGGGYFEGCKVTSTNDVVVDNTGDGLYLEGSSLRASHMTIAGNTNTNGGAGIYVINYLVPMNVSSKLKLNHPIVLTNTIVVSHVVGIDVKTEDTVSLNGVLWFGNDVNITSVGVVAITHPITGAPAFSSDGYHILPNSLAIEAGVDTAVKTDIDNQPRPNGIADLGADEYWPPEMPRPVRFYLPLIQLGLDPSVVSDH